MQIENDSDKEVYNGGLGVVRGIDAEAGEIMVEFDGAVSPTGSVSSTSCLGGVRQVDLDPIALAPGELVEVGEADPGELEDASSLRRHAPSSRSMACRPRIAWMRTPASVRSCWSRTTSGRAAGAT